MRNESFENAYREACARPKREFSGCLPSSYTPDNRVKPATCQRTAFRNVAGLPQRSGSSPGVQQKPKLPIGSSGTLALDLLEGYQNLLRAILLGVAMQYRSLDAERCRLLEQPICGPDPEELQLAASTITLWALLGFQQQTQRAGGDATDLGLGAASIGIGLLRLIRLLCAQPQAGEQETVEELETVEEFGLPNGSLESA